MLKLFGLIVSLTVVSAICLILFLFYIISLKVLNFFFKLGTRIEIYYFKKWKLTNLVHYLLLLALSLFVPFFGHIIATGAYYQWCNQQDQAYVAQPQFY